MEEEEENRSKKTGKKKKGKSEKKKKNEKKGEKGSAALRDVGNGEKRKKGKRKEKAGKEKKGKRVSKKKSINLSSSDSSFLSKFNLDEKLWASFSIEEQTLELEYLVASESWEKRYQTPSESEKRLLIASENGNLEDVRRCVLENGASVHIRSRDCGWTPLHLGSSEPDVVRFLLEQEADPNAREDRHPDFLDEEQGSEVGNRLTPLLFACSHGNLESVRLMVEKGGDLSRLNCDGETVLHLAVEAGEMSLIRFLVQYNPQLVTTPDSSGRYPFGALVRDGNIEGMKLFIQHGARIDELLDGGESYIRIATFFKQTEAKKFLLDWKERMNKRAKEEEGQNENSPICETRRRGKMHFSEPNVPRKFLKKQLPTDPLEASLKRFKSFEI